MSIRERIFKAASYIFMTLMLLLIVISFGMPDFISSSAESNRMNAAKVGSETVSLREVGQIRNQMMQQYGADVSEALKPMIEKQALERAIYRKLFELILKTHDLEPSGSAANKILAQAYRDNFSNFIENGKFDFQQLEKYMRDRGFTRTEFEQSILADYALTKGQTLLQQSSVSSKLDVIEKTRAKETSFSISLVIVDDAVKNQLFKKELKISEAEIQERFKKDYLSKDPKDTLTAIKREAIEKAIINDKKAGVETNIKEDLNKRAENMSINAFAASLGVTPIAIQNVTAEKSLNAAKPKDAPDLSFLDTNLELQKAIFKADLNKVQKPLVESEKQIYFAITGRKLSDLPSLSAFSTDKEKIASISAGIKDFETENNQLKGKRFESAFSAMMESFRNSVKIVRFMGEPEPKS